MQTIPREQLYIALFAFLSKTPGFSSYYRRFVPLAQIGGAKMPALMMRQTNEQRHVNAPGQPAKYTVSVDLLVLCQTPTATGDSVPASTLNPLVDAVEAMFDPQTGGETIWTPLGAAMADNVQTLGLSNVSRVWIEGNIEFEEAVQGSTDISAALIPLHIVLT